MTGGSQFALNLTSLPDGAAAEAWLHFDYGERSRMTKVQTLGDSGIFLFQRKRRNMKAAELRKELEEQGVSVTKTMRKADILTII